MKHLVITFTTILLLSACGNSNKEVQDKLRDEVIAIHDKVMPEMGAITKLQKEIEAEMEGLDSTATAKMEELKKKNEELGKAEEEMMKWMRQYKGDFQDKSHEEVMEYLEDQKKKIEQVEAQMTGAIQKAKEYLEVEKPE